MRLNNKGNIPMVLRSSPTNTSPNCQLHSEVPPHQPHSFPAPHSILIFPIPPTSAQLNLFTFSTPVPPMPPTAAPPPALADSFLTPQGRIDAFELCVAEDSWIFLNISLFYFLAALVLVAACGIFSLHRMGLVDPRLFPNQGLKPQSLHCKMKSSPLDHQGSSLNI